MAWRLELYRERFFLYIEYKLMSRIKTMVDKLELRIRLKKHGLSRGLAKRLQEVNGSYLCERLEYNYKYDLTLCPMQLEAYFFDEYCKDCDYWFPKDSDDDINEVIYQMQEADSDLAPTLGEL